ncbi:MarR family winged helix-turn-helix transcriptional regulator [Parvularcula lutaonensis]|uniref:MarR family winged helix-turn-helix transcriptional regulator n=1 Tax=Parvularcula lutaonensis TaxID=491923 RepID=A0ABV7MA24_9PROT|nr:MarR family transcriptional regulator [Parvularcula lutaonensis]GGY46882.1 MarR family transcriptional regulator [Parvularcula lutaonensis]
MSQQDLLTPWRDVMVELVRDDQPDLSMRQWALLLTVYLTPGPHTVRRLSEDLEVPKPAISRALDALSIHGFVKRERDQGDRRVVLVRKTAEGSQFIDRFAAAVDASERSADLGYY